MGIKVKHEGNVTSRVVAANLGGQAQSSQQQATAAAQRAASENMAANRQLTGAHAAGAHAQLTSAQLTHASPGSISAPKYDPRYAEFMVTGVDRNNKPDDVSEWNEEKQVWQKRQRPGDYDADALSRILAVRRDAGFGMAIDKERATIATQPTVGSPPPTPAVNPNDATGAAPQVWGLTEEGKAFDAILKKQMADKKAKLDELIAKKSRGVLGATGETPSVGAATPDATPLAFKPPEAPAAQKPFKIPGFSEALDLAGVYDVGGKLFGQGGALGNASGVDYNSSTEDIFKNW